MINISMKSMLEAGVHFGHQTRRWNPKMSRYIFGERNNIHIIDLQKTVKELKKAYTFIRDAAAEGKTILFVGTKKQAQEIVKAEAVRAGAPYVTEKWLGGTLTNFSTICKSVQRLEELERWERDGIFGVISNKELARLTKEMARLRKLLTGIRSMGRLPNVVFLVDPVEEDLAVMEARKLRIPIVAVCDTNCDPDLIDYPIPGNDDAARSIKLFCAVIADGVVEGREAHQKAKSGIPAASGAVETAGTVEASPIDGAAESSDGSAAPAAEDASNPEAASTAELGEPLEASGNELTPS
ncbi:MAG: 30S ribosomal protein S2 [Elusimicrobia bacterium]|nr:30S ribosomal protein S2 [Elusimicrobiota bacterium]